MKYAILAHRSSLSVCGAASALCKGKDGEPMIFDELAQADDQTKKYNETCASRNVSYETVIVKKHLGKWVVLSH
jgi:hypothetical protein